MISFEQVTKRYGERLALDSVSWHMDEGESVVLLGHSGAGKTTLLKLITHETQPTSGMVTVGTFRGGRLSRARRALLRRTLGIIYEDFRLLHDRSVFENVALAVRIGGAHRDVDVVPRVLYALEEVGLQTLQTKYPSELSAGEKQRAAIARAIVNRPAVILADEPTGALEPQSARDILDLLKRIHGEGAALVLATARPDVAETLGAWTLRIEEGRIVSEGRGTASADPRGRHLGATPGTRAGATAGPATAAPATAGPATAGPASTGPATATPPAPGAPRGAEPSPAESPRPVPAPGGPVSEAG